MLRLAKISAQRRKKSPRNQHVNGGGINHENKQAAWHGKTRSAKKKTGAWHRSGSARASRAGISALAARAARSRRQTATALRRLGGESISASARSAAVAWQTAWRSENAQKRIGEA
jgi:hypothetical protein